MADAELPSDPEMPLWASWSVDQMAAALIDGNPAAYGSVALDGYLRACDLDRDVTFHGQEIHFDRHTANLATLNYPNLLLLAAEACRRLHDERGAT